jgi:NitT/TauT family transport system ATP-binding protein
MTGTAYNAAEADDVCIPLRLDALRVGYGGRGCLDVGQLELLRSEVVAIVGRSGVGKTSLLTCLSGQLPPRGGTFYLGGCERGRGLRSTFVSRTLQNFPLFHWLTVEGNLNLAAHIRGAPEPDVNSVLSTFSAVKLRHRYPATLSGGERCRASLSQAMVGRPALLLLDEPFTGLDAMTKRVVAQNLFELARADGAAILFVTHDIADAVSFAERVIVVGGEPIAQVVGEVESSETGATDKVLRLLSQEEDR